MAFVAGAFAGRLPVPAVIATALRTALAAAPPALAVVGAISLAGHFRGRSREGPSARPPRSADHPEDFPLENDTSIVFPDSSPVPPAPRSSVVA
jgi:hypothetical protein